MKMNAEDGLKRISRGKVPTSGSKAEARSPISPLRRNLMQIAEQPESRLAQQRRVSEEGMRVPYQNLVQEGRLLRTLAREDRIANERRENARQRLTEITKAVVRSKKGK